MGVEAPHVSAGGERVYGEGGALCRAFFKLDEALLRFPSICILEPGGTALDIGASPGGWTQVLASRVGKDGRVFAVDPGALTIDPLPASVTHLQAKLEDAVTQLIACLEAEGRKLDAVVCDANVHPGATGRFLAQV